MAQLKFIVDYVLFTAIQWWVIVKRVIEEQSKTKDGECSLKVWCFCMTTRHHALLHAQLKLKSSIRIFWIISHYSHDLTPSDYHLFSKLKPFIASQHFGSNVELMKGVNQCSNTHWRGLFLRRVYKNLFQVSKNV